MIEIIADDLPQRLREVSGELYQKGAEIAEKRSNILADTKFEFGIISEKRRQKKWPLSWKTENYRIIKTNGGSA
jgi:hypothetical protein